MQSRKNEEGSAVRSRGVVGRIALWGLFALGFVIICVALPLVAFTL
jgi:hypothetical protein